VRGLEISDHFSKSISLSKKTVQIVYLDDASEVIKYYKMRGGIEAMFRDYKSGGYNLEGSKANTHRLTNLILLIAIAYTASALKGKSIKNKGYQKYISRLTEPKKYVRRHSDFWVGLYGQSWILAWDFCSGITEELIKDREKDKERDRKETKRKTKPI